jgi:hypothetical protein
MCTHPAHKPDHTTCELVGFVALIIIIHLALPFYCARVWLKERRLK